jgi:hypothetical protein
LRTPLHIRVLYTFLYVNLGRLRHQPVGKKLSPHLQIYTRTFQKSIPDAFCGVRIFCRQCTVRACKFFSQTKTTYCSIQRVAPVDDTPCGRKTPRAANCFGDLFICRAVCVKSCFALWPLGDDSPLGTCAFLLLLISMHRLDLRLNPLENLEKAPRVIDAACTRFIL